MYILYCYGVYSLFDHKCAVIIKYGFIYYLFQMSKNRNVVIVKLLLYNIHFFFFEFMIMKNCRTSVFYVICLKLTWPK